MNRKLFLMMALGLPLSAANAQSVEDTLVCNQSSASMHYLQPLKPTYMNDVTVAANWRQNWFIEVKGGGSTFLGNPLGCEDFFGRTKPLFQAAVGKWFTPAVGARVSYQGFKFKDSEIKNRTYNNVHADFLYNISSHFNEDEFGQPIWDLIPFVGVGIIHNDDMNKKPFAMHYGVMGRYRITRNLHIAAEIGGMTTFRDFDGRGAENKFGDNMLSFSLGLSYTIGKAGWNKVVEAKPYMDQNEWLLAHIGDLNDKNKMLEKQHQADNLALSQMRKILEIEGLLMKYINDLPSNRVDDRTYPKNDYSGLNSLRARMANERFKNDVPSITEDTLIQAPVAPVDLEAYLADMQSGKVCIGSPIYFFFRLGTSQLTEPSQRLNIDEIAKLVKKYGLRVKITGAADSETGSREINDNLSDNRSNMLANELIRRGVDTNMIIRVGLGGISEFQPKEVNRQTKVELFF